MGKTKEEVEAYLRHQVVTPNACGRHLATWLADVATTEDDAYARICDNVIIDATDEWGLSTNEIPQRVLFVAGYVVRHVHDKRAADRRQQIARAYAAAELLRRLMATLLEESGDLPNLARRSGIDLCDVRILAHEFRMRNLMTWGGKMSDEANSDHLVRYLNTLGRQIAIEQINPL